MTPEALRMFETGFGRLLGSLIGMFLVCLSPCGCGPSKGVNPNDPRIVYEEPFRMNTGYKAYNGKAYDKATLCIKPAAKLVLPEEASVARHDEADEVIVYMEKSMHLGCHLDHSVSIKDERNEMGCVVKLEKEG